MSTILTLDLTTATKSDPGGQITELDANKVKFESNASNGVSEILFNQITIPATATFLLFDIKTAFQGENPQLGNVNVGIQPPGQDSFFQIVQGEFKGTLTLDLSTVSGEIPWLGISFPGGEYGSEEFIATVSNLRFVDETTVPGTLDLTTATKSDPDGQITELDANKVEFKSNASNGVSEIMFNQITIPATATYLLFDVKTVFQGESPQLGNVNVGIQPSGQDSFFQIVQGEFKGTPALDLSTVGGEIPWLGISFPGGAYGSDEFIATVSNLRFVGNHDLSSAPPSTPSNLKIK